MGVHPQAYMSLIKSICPTYRVFLGSMKEARWQRILEMM
jgi:hypothetical protein